MTKPTATPLPIEKTLAEQKSDFTAEGSPPPGTVSTAVPATPPRPETAVPQSHPQPHPAPPPSTALRAR